MAFFVPLAIIAGISLLIGVISEVRDMREQLSKVEIIIKGTAAMQSETTMNVGIIKEVILQAPDPLPIPVLEVVERVLEKRSIGG